MCPLTEQIAAGAFDESAISQRLTDSVTGIDGVAALAPSLRCIVATATARVLRGSGGVPVGVDLGRTAGGVRVRVDAHLDDRRPVTATVDEIFAVVEVASVAGTEDGAAGPAAALLTGKDRLGDGSEDEIRDETHDSHVQSLFGNRPCRSFLVPMLEPILESRDARRAFFMTSVRTQRRSNPHAARSWARSWARPLPVPASLASPPAPPLCLRRSPTCPCDTAGF